MKIKVKSSYFEESTGTSVVTVTSPLGEFTGYAYFNSDEDVDPRIMSRYFGCGIAETRARILALKAELNKVTTELNVLTELRDRVQIAASARNKWFYELFKPYNIFTGMYMSRWNRKENLEEEILTLQNYVSSVPKGYYEAKAKSLAAIDGLNKYSDEILGQ